MSAKASPRGPVVAPADPAWLAAHLQDPSVRVLDVREGAPRADASGPRLRTARTVDLRTFAPHAGTPGWNASRDRHPDRDGPPESFRESHVPGAVWLDVRARLFDEEGELVSAPELALAMSSLGVGDEHTIVLVDDLPQSAALAAAWALERYGHPRVLVLEGGFGRWLSQGRPVTRDMVRHPVASFTARAGGAIAR